MKTLSRSLPVLLLILMNGVGCINTKPRPMTIACGVSKEEFVRECARLLTQSGYRLIEENTAIARVRATKGQNQTNIGENMQYNGPYLFDAAYHDGTIIVSVATIMRVNGADERPVIVQTHNETRNTSSSDKAYFVPVLNGLRKLCNK